MAKGKKASGKVYTSKGERPNCNQKFTNMVKNSKSYLENTLNKMEAFAKGKNVWFTVPNPNPNETNKRFIRIKGRELYGDFRDFGKPPRLKGSE